MPMVDHAMASRTNIERLRQVYHQLYKYRDPSNEFGLFIKNLVYSNFYFKELNSILFI